LNTEVDDQEWKIKFEERVRNMSEFNVFITVPDLKEINVSGSGDITGRGVFRTGGDLTVMVSGSGNIDMQLECADLNSRVSGSGDIELSGQCEEADLSISGSGSIGGSDFNCKNARVQISGSGDVKLDVESYLDVSISGSGDVIYGGQPKIKSRISGSGEINHKPF
jgi:autotransporter translocation and assembly factor TamB